MDGVAYSLILYWIIFLIITIIYVIYLLSKTKTLTSNYKEFISLINEYDENNDNIPVTSSGLFILSFTPVPANEEECINQTYPLYFKYNGIIDEVFIDQGSTNFTAMLTEVLIQKNPMEIIVKSMYEVLDDLTFSKDNYTSDYSINFCKKTLNWLKQYEDELSHYKAIFEKTYNTFNDYYIFWLKCLFILFVLGIMFAQGYGLGYYSQHLCEEKKNDFNPLPREN